MFWEKRARLALTFVSSDDNILDLGGNTGGVRRLHLPGMFARRWMDHKALGAGCGFERG